MSPEFGVFLTPLVLLPGVALLVMSTSARYAQLHGEFHHLGAQHSADPPCDPLERSRRLLRRGRLFQTALVGLYSAVSLLALASLVGGALKLLAPGGALAAVLVLTCLAVASLLFATVQLVRESMLSFQVLRDHAEDIERDHA